MAVLQRSELESSPLADLHAIASELGLEGFRAKRKDDLIGAILAAQGGEEAAPEAPDAPEVPSDEPLEAVAPEQPVDEAEPEEPADEAEPEEPAGESEAEVVEEEPEVEEEVSDEQIAAGLLDVLTNGSGFLRLDPAGQSRDDVYVSPAQIRRCELRAGDEVSGPVRPPRRNERHPSLVRVETVNGADADSPEERPLFSDLTPVFPRERLEGPKDLKDAPFGKGSRVAIAGAPGAGASSLLREIAATLAGKHPDLELQVVLVGARPEEAGEWRADAKAPVTGGSFDESPDAQTQAAEL